MGITWESRETDREFFDKNLNTFVPDRVFDAHAHLYKIHHWGFDHPTAAGPSSVGLDTYRDQMQWILPGRRIAGLFFGVGFHPGFRESNEFVASEVAKDERCYGEMLVPPDFEAEAMREEAKRLGFTGLKVYHRFLLPRPSWNVDILEFLAEDHCRVADEEGWVITLHIVKDLALADKRNQEQIRYLCTRYKNMKLILAHAARGFNPFHTIEGIAALKGLCNVWFDTSAVTEAGSFEAIIETFGHERLLWGSDYPLSHLRGRCVGIGNGFLWLLEDSIDWRTAAGQGVLEPLFYGTESLRALKLAAMRMRLTDRQLEDIFYGNAAEMLAIPKEP